MKLLIVTQVMDTEHPILGFFVRWVEEFAKHCEQVHVVCLEAGKHSLPANVTVHSLGKERSSTPSSLRGAELGEAVETNRRSVLEEERSDGKGLTWGEWKILQKLRYALRFYQLIWDLRHEYDAVFVHMNPIYAVVGAPVWWLLGKRKRVGLWYTHGTVSSMLRVAEKLVAMIFTATADSCKLESRKVIVTGHGIDTARFAPQTGPKDLDLITVGRIARSKNLTALIDALALLPSEVTPTLTIVGAAVTEAEQAYETELRAYISAKGLTARVIFAGKQTQRELPATLRRAKIFVTAAQNGSLDKAMLEAMACGLPIISMAPGSSSLPLSSGQVTSPAAMAAEISSVLKSERLAGVKNREYVTEKHSLAALVPQLSRLLT